MQDRSLGGCLRLRAACRLDKIRSVMSQRIKGEVTVQNFTGANARNQVEIGTEQRQIVAGIARHYSPEDLVGKLVVVVSNLLPATLMKEESHGMVLAASDADGKLVIVTPESPVQSGSSVK